MVKVHIQSFEKQISFGFLEPQNQTFVLILFISQRQERWERCLKKGGGGGRIGVTFVRTTGSVFVQTVPSNAKSQRVSWKGNAAGSIQGTTLRAEGTSVCGSLGAGDTVSEKQDSRSDICVDLLRMQPFLCEGAGTESPRLRLRF